jgi:predicted transcriptional regulator of viral defense system
MANINTNYIMNLLFDNDIFYFQPKQLSTILKIDIKTAYDIIQRLKNKDIIREIENGKYLVTGYDKKRMISNPFYLATHVVVPSYISYLTILNYYGYTEQVPKFIFCATTKQKKDMNFENYVFKYIKIKKDKLYGYKKEFINDFPSFIAEPEKAIIDSIDLPNYAGGIKEISKIIRNALDSINQEKLVEYTIRFPNKSMVSRIGYLFEKNDVELKELLKFKSKSFVLLNPKKKKSSIWDKKWNINVNEEM